MSLVSLPSSRFTINFRYSTPASTFTHPFPFDRSDPVVEVEVAAAEDEDSYDHYCYDVPFSYYHAADNVVGTVGRNAGVEEEAEEDIVREAYGIQDNILDAVHEGRDDLDALADHAVPWVAVACLHAFRLHAYADCAWGDRTGPCGLSLLLRPLPLLPFQQDSYRFVCQPPSHSTVCLQQKVASKHYQPSEPQILSLKAHQLQIA
mmetsp:Transcript_94/g.182  ORF Transcript_94/g.182 Transcript_94/m.182 type:complete len:205 (+) Transcript_94:188-802(+)